MEMIVDTILAALEGRQIQPLLLGPPPEGQVTGGKQ
jgi:dipicolinate synthase subunit B